MLIYTMQISKLLCNIIESNTSMIQYSRLKLFILKDEFNQLLLRKEHITQ